jgi:hypothetical protein
MTPTTDRAQQDRGAPAPGWTFAAVCLAFFAAILDTTIVNVALPPSGRACTRR